MANATNRVGIIASALAATAAGILFVAFMAGLRQRGLLARGDGLAALGYGCGLLFVMGMFATFCTWAAVPGMIQLAGNPVPSGDVIRLSFALGAAFVALPVPLCAGAFAIAVARDAARTRAIPRWLGTAGMVVGAAQVVGVFYFPLWLFPVWVASVGAVLLWRPSTQRRTTAAKAEATP